MSVSRDDVRDAVLLAAAVGGVIRDMGQIPSGLLYSMMMHKMSLITYNSLITLLVNQRLIRQGANHMLVWIGDSTDGSTTDHEGA